MVHVDTGKIALHNVYCTEYRVYIGGGVNAYLLGVTASTDKRKIPFMHPAIIWYSARISGHDVRVGNELGIFERIAQISSTSTVKDYQSCLIPADNVKLSELEQRVRSEGAHSKVLRI